MDSYDIAFADDPRIEQLRYDLANARAAGAVYKRLWEDSVAEVGRLRAQVEAGGASHIDACDCHDSWDQCPCAEAGHFKECACCGTGICGPIAEAGL